MNNKVTKEEVEDNMKDIEVRTLYDFGKPCTYVVCKMKNGFTIRDSTTCVDPSNYDENIGADICKEHIENKIWYLLGYALQERMYQSKDTLKATAYQMLSDDRVERMKAEYKQLKIRAERLRIFIHKGNFYDTPKELFTKQLSLMEELIKVLEERAKYEGISYEEV